jgi:hypothetical protein
MNTDEMSWRIVQLEDEVRKLTRQTQALDEAVERLRPKAQYVAMLTKDKPLQWVPIE